MTKPDPLRAALHDNPEWPCSCSGLYDENRHTAAVRVALAADTAHAHPCEQCDQTVDYWVKRALAAEYARLAKERDQG